MKSYTEQKNKWKESKALSFFLNFIRNHNDYVHDNDTFELVSGLRTHEEWIGLIKKTFPEDMIKRMEENTDRHNRLDFTDERKEIIREIWSSEYARDRLRGLLSSVTEEELQKKPIEQHANECFAKKVSELQSVLKLSDRETDILLILVFNGCGLLEIENCHSAGSKALFIAKYLDCDLAEVMPDLSENGKLRRYQCIDRDLDYNGSLSRFLNGFSDEPLTSMYFTKNKEETLPWEFYGALAEKHGELIERIISSCDGTNSAHILLYAVGTAPVYRDKVVALADAVLHNLTADKRIVF